MTVVERAIESYGDDTRDGQSNAFTYWTVDQYLKGFASMDEERALPKNAVPDRVEEEDNDA